MKRNDWQNKSTDSLFKTILKLKDLEEASRFFRDLLTKEEIKEFAKRWEVAQMLSNKISYSTIEKETGMSTTTIARVSKWLNNGCGGYKRSLQKLHHQSLSH